MTKSSSASEMVTLTVGQELAEKFHKHISFDEEVIGRATRQAEKFKATLSEGLLADSRKATTCFDEYQRSGGPEPLLEAKRLVLALKSNAGMADQPMVTEMAALLFELLDDGYDVTASKVKDSIVLYLRTIREMLENRAEPHTAEENDRLLTRFRELNQHLR